MKSVIDTGSCKRLIAQRAASELGLSIQKEVQALDVVGVADITRAEMSILITRVLM